VCIYFVGEALRIGGNRLHYCYCNGDCYWSCELPPHLRTATAIADRHRDSQRCLVINLFQQLPLQSAVAVPQSLLQSAVAVQR
jgi:hypothetical protein